MTKKRIRKRSRELAIIFAAGLLPVSGFAETLPELDCLVEPNVVVDIGSPEHGVVQTIAVDRSDTISANDVLAQLESSEQAANVRKARARANMAAEVNARKATLDYAERKQQRMRDLYASDAISSQQRDEVETELKMAQMQLQQARDAGSLARIELDRAVGDLERRTIRSPISGIVVERFVAPGEYVNEKPLLRVAQMHPLRVETVVPASLFGKIKTGMHARVVSETLAGQVFDAEVKIVDRMIDAASGTFGVRLELPNPDYAIPSGLNCKLRIDAVIPQKVATKKAVDANRLTAAKAGISRSDSVSSTPSAAVAKLNEKTTQQCRSFGPFRSEKQLEALIASLGKNSREIDRRQVADETVVGYLVMTKPLASIDAAKILADSIKQLGISDLAVMTSAKYKGRVSLGMYDARHNAVKRMHVLQSMDVDVEILPRHGESTRYWSDVELSASVISQASWAKTAPEIVANTCSESDYVTADIADDIL